MCALDWSVRPFPRSLQYTVSLNCLTTLPCHGLVDTGAQEGTVGLWHWQRWVANLGLVHKLRPGFLPIPQKATAGGIGGDAKILAVCDMPTGLAGANGLTRWVVLDEAEDQRIPPLIPNKLLIHFNAVLEPKQKLLTLRDLNTRTTLEELPSEHHTMSLMVFSKKGWSAPSYFQTLLVDKNGHNPFKLEDDPIRTPDKRVCVSTQ